MTSKIIVNIPSELYEALAVEASKQGLTVHQLASQIIREILQNQENNNDD